MSEARRIDQLVPPNTNGGDLAPLLANDAYTRAANAELACAHDAAAATAAAMAVDDNYRGVIDAFVKATSGLREIAKRFPEVSKFIDEAIKQVQLAMSACAGNPVPKVSPATVPVVPTPAPAPSSAVVAARAQSASDNDVNLARIREAAAKARAKR